MLKIVQNASGEFFLGKTENKTSHSDGFRNVWDSNTTKYSASSDLALKVVNSVDSLKALTEIYDSTMLYQEFAPLKPIYERFLANMRKKYCDGKNNDFCLKGIQAFLDAFNFSAIPYGHYKIKAVDESCITDDSRPYWSVVDTKYRSRFFDLEEEKKILDDGSVDKHYLTVQNTRCWLKLNDITDTEIHAVVQIGLDMDGFKPLYKNSAITAQALLKYFSPIESIYTAYEVLAQDIGITIDSVEICGLLAEDSEWVSCHNILACLRFSKEPHIHSLFNIIGTEDELNLLQQTFDRFGITCKDEQKVVITEEELTNQQTRALFNGFSMSNDNLMTSRDYGCFMFLAWLAFSDFFMDSWRKFSDTRDWMHLIGLDNAVDVLGRLTTYAVVETPTDTVLITSGGFLRLTFGTPENPEVVEWMNLETAKLVSGVTNVPFSESKYIENRSDAITLAAQRRVRKQTNSRYVEYYYINNDPRCRYLVQAMSFLYRLSYGKLSANYNKEWLTESCRDVNPFHLSNKADLYQSAGYYTDLYKDMESKVSGSCFTGSQYKIYRKANYDNYSEEYNCVESRVMREILSIMDALLCSGYKVRICETPLGNKKKPSVMWSMDEVNQSEYYRKLPKEIVTERLVMH